MFNTIINTSPLRFDTSHPTQPLHPLPFVLLPGYPLSRPRHPPFHCTRSSSSYRRPTLSLH
ncbi:hypothetical protein L211DRAFT_842019 [Terfezia boudieri ATCC MYA-4762]|uniref:Uncharacterized protein n=1 Tax=Terfezia boudieri ATCC MYA-4762 TaxID=1051890 RepID=A0A3N4LB45_9PEZI|nr:hypothetical protein L211DRAFT_842019 [Terfezia boudieri ATCC MYA-4762]